MASQRDARAAEANAAHVADARAAGQASAAAAEVEAALRVPPDPRAAAFFDVDNTVMQGASIFHLARGLYARDFFTARDIGRFAWAQAKFRVIGREDIDAFLHAMGRSSGPPWQAKHKLAAAAALAATGLQRG